MTGQFPKRRETDEQAKRRIEKLQLRQLENLPRRRTSLARERLLQFQAEEAKIEKSKSDEASGNGDSD